MNLVFMYFNECLCDIYITSNVTLCFHYNFFSCICYRKIMARLRRTPRRVSTSVQRERIKQLLFKLDEYRMKESDDMISHIIEVNKMIQQSIWEGNWIGQPNRFRMLHNTLPEIWQMRLTKIWESVTQTEKPSIQYNAAIKRLAIESIRLKAMNTAFPLKCRGCRRDSRSTIGYKWLSKIQYKLPQEFKDSFPKTMITRDSRTEKILSVRY